MAGQNCLLKELFQLNISHLSEKLTRTQKKVNFRSAFCYVGHVDESIKLFPSPLHYNHWLIVDSKFDRFG
jgi:hypothetical protein